MAITDGKTHDLTAARALQLPRGSIVVMDRGYNDYAWYNQLNNNDIHAFKDYLKARKSPYKPIVPTEVPAAPPPETSPGDSAPYSGSSASAALSKGASRKSFA